MVRTGPAARRGRRGGDRVRDLQGRSRALRGAVNDPLPTDLRYRLEAYGASVAEVSKIAHATRYLLARGSEKATLDVYHTGKVAEGGKESGLKALLRDWRLSRTARGA